jgi:hypothetical protein
MSLQSIITKQILPGLSTVDLIALMRGEGTIVFTFDDMLEILVYIYPTKATVTVFNEKTIIQSCNGLMLLRGLEDHIPFLSFISRNLSGILNFEEPEEN